MSDDAKATGSAAKVSTDSQERQPDCESVTLGVDLSEGAPVAIKGVVCETDEGGVCVRFTALGQPLTIWFTKDEMRDG